MIQTSLIAKHLKDVHFGGNWTCSNLKDNLTGVTWLQATTQIYSLNTIAALVYHINYYIGGVIKVLQGGSLELKDIYSYACPPIQNEEEWQLLLDKTFADANTFTALIEQLPDSQLSTIFVDEKYGTYYRNLQGIIEHTHYHLGQIAIIKKIILQMEAAR